jgi:hypothetical protein
MLPCAAVLLTLTLPRIHELMTSAKVEVVFARAGVELPVGARLADITVDLSSLAAQDCPPISHYRLVLRERAWLREVAVARGDDVPVGATLARLTTGEHDPLDAPPARDARIAIAGILAPADGWRDPA